MKFSLTPGIGHGIVNGRCNSLFFMPKFSLVQKAVSAAK